MVITHVRVTESWQGYYGNISGTITLDDANNYTLYDWSSPTPSGEIYASNGSSVTWSNIYCLNVTQNGSTVNGIPRPDGSVTNINGSQIELNFGINNTDKDGLTETFNDTFIDSFTVGSENFDVTDGCSAAHPYTNQIYAETEWQELLLSDNGTLIFTAIIRNNANGFQPGTEDTYDFQMLVLENGHTESAASTTPYYFFVELT